MVKKIALVFLAINISNSNFSMQQQKNSKIAALARAGILTNDMLKEFGDFEKSKKPECADIKAALVKGLTAQRTAVSKLPALRLLCSLPLQTQNFSPDSSKILVEDDDNLQIYDTRSGNLIEKIQYIDCECSNFRWSPCGTYLIGIVTDSFNERLIAGTACIDFKNRNLVYFKDHNVLFTANEKSLLVTSYHSGNALAYSYPFKIAQKLISYAQNFDLDDPKGQWIIANKDGKESIFDASSGFQDIAVIDTDSKPSTMYKFSPNGELFCTLQRKFDENDDYIAIFTAYNRKNNQSHLIPNPHWDWDFECSTLYINDQNNRVLLHDLDSDASQVYDLGTQQIVNREEEKNNQEEKHIYSRDLSKVIYIKKTPQNGSQVSVKDFNNTVLHTFNFNFPLDLAHHAHDDDHLMLFHEGKNDIITKVLINISSGQVLAQTKNNEKGFWRNIECDADNCFSTDGKYLTHDAKRNKTRIWQMPANLDPAKHSLAEIIAYCMLEINRIRQEKLSDAAQKVLASSNHKELRSFVQHSKHRRTASI